MKARTARDVNMAFGVILGALILLSVVLGAALYAPTFGYAVPSFLAWTSHLSLSSWLWFDSTISILFIAWVVFSYAERKPLGESPRRSRRGGAAAETVLVLVLVVFAIFVLTELGMNFSDVVRMVEHFFGG